MRLGVKVGQGCAKMLDTSMRDLPCNRLEMDEIWGFVGKKDRNVREGEDGVGSVWTFCAIDAETKLVPAFKVGHRDAATAKAFVQDVGNRMAYRASWKCFTWKAIRRRTRPMPGSTTQATCISRLRTSLCSTFPLWYPH